MNNFHWVQKCKEGTPAFSIFPTFSPTFSELGPKMKKIQENFEIFWSKSLWKIDFFHNFFTKYLLDFCLITESIYTAGSIRWHGPGLSRGRRVGGSGGGPPGRRRNFQKCLLKPMGNNNFRPIFHNFNENFPLKCLEFLAKLWEKLRSMRL